MKLDRNLPQNKGLGKYALLNLRKLERDETGNLDFEVWNALQVLERHHILEWGFVGTASEFFPIKLRDENAERALMAYSDSCHDNGDEEFAREVLDLALRAGPNHPLCKKPD